MWISQSDIREVFRFIVPWETKNKTSSKDDLKTFKEDIKKGI